MQARLLGLTVLSALLFGCAAEGRPHHHAKSPDEAEGTSENAAGEEKSEKWGDDQAPASDHEKRNHEKREGSDATPPEPEFKENMSVDAAIRAVPSGIERRDIDQETLGKPLQDLSVYEPCKPGSAHVKLRVAVWDGRAVGIDVTTTPKSEKLAACVKGRIAELRWEKKVKSLNTIEYQF